MINGLNIPSYKIVGDGLQLTGSTVKKGRGCDKKIKQNGKGLKILK